MCFGPCFLEMIQNIRPKFESTNQSGYVLLYQSKLSKPPAIVAAINLLTGTATAAHHVGHAMDDCAYHDMAY